VEIIVKGRHTEVSERYRAHVREKLARLARLDGKAFRVDVQVSHESNPRMSDMCERIELTVHSRGPITRAEAAAGDAYAALDKAFAKLEERLRRSADRRHARQHGHLRGSGATSKPAAAEAPAESELPELPETSAPLGAPEVAKPSLNGAASGPETAGPETAESETAEFEDLGNVLVAEGPLVVRQKTHEAPPMTLDEALHHMELVGHDFFLYCDAGCGLPSVVYRRRGYTYGVLRLSTTADATSETAPA
jgi:ribosomal subunit interface protein